MTHRYQEDSNLKASHDLYRFDHFFFLAPLTLFSGRTFCNDGPHRIYNLDETGVSVVQSQILLGLRARGICCNNSWTWLFGRVINASISTQKQKRLMDEPLGILRVWKTVKMKMKNQKWGSSLDYDTHWMQKHILNLTLVKILQKLLFGLFASQLHFRLPFC